MTSHCPRCLSLAADLEQAHGQIKRLEAGIELARAETRSAGRKTLKLERELERCALERDHFKAQLSTPRAAPKNGKNGHG